MAEEHGQDERPQVVLETPAQPVVRDSEDNPVVRFRDLEKVKADLELKIKVGFAVVGAIGVANLLGIKESSPERITTGALQLIQQISQSI